MTQPGDSTDPERASTPPNTAFVFTGGGARAAYQVGVMSWLSRRFPELDVPIVTGVSAGAVNAAFLAARPGTFGTTAKQLCNLWESLEPQDIFRVDAASLAWTLVRVAMRVISGGLISAPEVRSLLDTTPLRETLEEALLATDGRLEGVERRLERGGLRALAISTTSYSTGQSVVWLEATDAIEAWTRPQRRSVRADMSVDHIMASAALPLFFPAVKIGDGWYGDGGMRLAAPLSPALHLGADRILAISTRYDRSQADADRPSITGYPPPVQVFGILLNAVFLDLVDQDASRLERTNDLLRHVPPEKRLGMRDVDLVVMRPSQDLGRLSREYEPRLPKAFRYLTRGLGTRQTGSPDALSMLMFQPDYIKRVINLGREDAEKRADDLCEMFEA